MNEREFADLLISIDAPVESPEGLKEKILITATEKSTNHEPVLSGFERVIFEKPLRLAGLVSAAASGVLWVILGSGFPALVSSMIG